MCNLCSCQGNCSVIRAPVKKQWLVEGQIDRNDEYRDEDDEPVPSHIQSLLHEAKLSAQKAKSAANAARRAGNRASVQIQGASAAVASGEANALAKMHKVAISGRFIPTKGLASPTKVPASSIETAEEYVSAV